MTFICANSEHSKCRKYSENISLWKLFTISKIIKKCLILFNEKSVTISPWYYLHVVQSLEWRDNEVQEPSQPPQLVTPINCLIILDRYQKMHI